MNEIERFEMQLDKLFWNGYNVQITKIDYNDNFFCLTCRPSLNKRILEFLLYIKAVESICATEEGEVYLVLNENIQIAT